MANVGFGITQLDILGSGTPIIESTTGNLELKSTEIRLNGVVKFGSATITIDGDNGFINTGIITANNGIEIGTGSEKVAISTNLQGGVRVGQGITFGGAGDALMTGITTVGKQLEVGIGITMTAGIITATSFVKSGGTSSQYLMADGSTSTGGSGTTINNNANNRVITGSNSANTLEAESSLTYDGTTLTADSFSGSGNNIVAAKWTLGASGSSAYLFTGPGGLSSASKPVIYLARGHTYEFLNNSGGSHPFQIQTSGGSAYNTGVTNNNASSGTIKFEVPFDAPNTLRYWCTNHSGMGNTIIIYPDLSP